MKDIFNSLLHDAKQKSTAKKLERLNERPLNYKVDFRNFICSSTAEGKYNFLHVREVGEGTPSAQRLAVECPGRDRQTSQVGSVSSQRYHNQSWEFWRRHVLYIIRNSGRVHTYGQRGKPI